MLSLLAYTCCRVGMLQLSDAAGVCLQLCGAGSSAMELRGWLSRWHDIIAQEKDLPPLDAGKGERECGRWASHL